MLLLRSPPFLPLLLLLFLLSLLLSPLLCLLLLSPPCLLSILSLVLLCLLLVSPGILGLSWCQALSWRWLSTLRPTGPHISIGDCPGTSGTSSEFHDNSFPFTAIGDKESPYLGKGEFSKSFQEMISLITYFPKSKPSVYSGSDSLTPWLDVFGNTRRRTP